MLVKDCLKYKKYNFIVISRPLSAQLSGWRMNFLISILMVKKTFHCFPFSSEKMLVQWFSWKFSLYRIWKKVGVNFRFLCLILVIYTGSLMSFFMGKVEKRFQQRRWRCNYISCVYTRNVVQEMLLALALAKEKKKGREKWKEKS